ncbi:DinB family protein [Brevibacillus humidisoli]|uniref:DinB family protein n=1 Tax=Brevibacillus humidisoli TaxID=2895522 RepID=UPI001E2AF68F|nr:DinB family protein [Brevibacillus humidisoli]UFJ40733.1 DinB family protein [Brevibacillus humidisoli]
MEKRHAVLFQQLEDYRHGTLRLVADVTEEMADVVPAGFSNNIRWNLGHIYLDQYLWIQHLTKEPIQLPDGYLTWFNYGTKPADWQGSVPSLDTLRELLGGQIGWIRQQYGDRLEEEFPATESGMHTIAQVLVRTIYHEALHAGAILSIRRML